MMNILVVDDNALNIEAITRRLEQDGFHTYKAEHGRQALMILENFPVDLVLLDVMMPEMDGFEVLKKIKQAEQWQDIPVVMVSALEQEDSVVRCLEDGADDYLTKPVNSVLLRARVNNALNKKRLHDNEKQYQHELESYNQQLKHKVEQQVSEIVSAQMSMIFATSKLAESKDPETGAHLERRSSANTWQTWKNIAISSRRNILTVSMRPVLCTILARSVFRIACY